MSKKKKKEKYVIKENYIKLEQIIQAKGSCYKE